MTTKEPSKELYNFVIRYESWEAYNAETKEEAIAMFKSENNHRDDEIIEVS